MAALAIKRSQSGKAGRRFQAKPPYYPAGSTPDERGKERPRARGDQQSVRVRAHAVAACLLTQ